MNDNTMGQVNKYVVFALIFLVFTGFSCKTYYIPVESFKQQFQAVNHLALKEVTVKGPAGDKVKYKTVPIEFINCTDDKGNPQVLKNSPSLEIRFTDSSNKRTIFYFDLISINDSSITGTQSRFIPSITKTILLTRIKKIEIQDGKKKFKYVTN